MSLSHFHNKKFEIHPLEEHAKETRLGNLDARAKLIGVLLFVLVSALLTRPELVFASLALSLTLAGVSGVPGRHLARSYLAAAPFIFLASFSIFLFTDLQRGMLMLMRTSTCVLALLVLASSTDSFSLFSGLRRLRVPAIMTTLLMLSQKYIVILSEELSRMAIARQARGFRGGRNLLDKYSFKVLSYTAGMVFVRASGRADRVYEGLKARGFEKDMAGWRETSLGAREVVFASVLGATAIVLMALQLGVAS